MRRSVLYYGLITLSLFVSTNVQSQLQKIYLNPKGTGVGKQSQFVDSVRFIPLESKKGIEFGYTNVSITEKYFLLTDYAAKLILLYTKDGQFARKISFKKLGERFYPRYDEATNLVVFFGDNKNYSLTPKDRLKIKKDWTNPRNQKYFTKYVIDLNDSLFAIRKVTPDENDILNAYRLYDDFYWQGKISTGELKEDTVDYEVKIYRDHQLVRGFFPYNPDNEARFLFGEENASFSKTDSPFIHFVTRPYCDTIYKMKRDSLFPVYKLVLPLENSLPEYFFTRPFKNKTERENFRMNNGWMFHQVYNFFESPGYIYFLVKYLNNFESYIYQKQSNLTFKAKNIKADNSQYNLPLLSQSNVQINGDKFYKTQKAGDLISFFEQNSNVPVPMELEGFLKSKPSKNTPVIIEFKLKN